ncbi:MAG: 6-pyruvoyl-tetrahydropterin synthase-related protein, partial [Candidatus Promineifilaceae bacterium]|nr:6-pyruvoyl-tetrahydropterin synthase-related protein [Candidatus Promineifilaceae bacterium]
MQKLERFVKRIDPGFLVVLAISFIAVWPFISRASLPEGTDAELHIFRLFELSHLLRGGELYPRWAPNFYHGYGYPIFNYYAPLTYYIGFLVELTPWADAVVAVKTVFVLGIFLSGFGIYGFVRDNWGRRAGYVAAAVFLYTPYVQYIDPHARGVLPESFSFGVFVCALWALNRVRISYGRWPWLVSVFLTAAVILSHNLMGLLFFGILTAWVIWLLLFDYRDKDHRIQAARYLLPVLGLGLGFAAFFWLPVILEQNAVNLDTLIGRQDNYDFHTHFLSLGEMFATTMILDRGETEPEFRFNLGIIQWILAGLGMLLLGVGKVKGSRHLTFFATLSCVLIFLMLPWSTIIWESLPFLPYFQFPWRLLGATATMLAVLAGTGSAAFCDLLCDRRWSNVPSPQWLKRCDSITILVFVALPIVAGLPLSQPPEWSDFGEVNHLRMTLIENTGRWLGTTSTADYVPATVDTIPTRQGSVVAPFDRGLPPDRVNWANLPEDATVETETVRPLLTRYKINTPRNTRFRIFQFDFPGWRAKIDGQLVETELGRP